MTDSFRGHKKFRNEGRFRCKYSISCEIFLFEYHFAINV